jgi:tight adherence protein C
MAVIPARAQPDLLTQRLRYYVEPDPTDLDALKLQQPLFERVLQPLLATIGRLLLHRTPEKQVEELRRKLSLIDSTMRAEQLMATKFIGMVGGAAVGLLGVALLGVSGPITYALPAGALILGYLFPERSVNTRLRKRAEDIRLNLPNALDLLTIAMEAGSSLDAALVRVAAEDFGAITQEFRRVINEIQLGRPRREAMMAMAERNQIEELTDCIHAVVQAEPLGVSLATVMRVQSEELRRLRRQRAEEAGAKAPVKMLIPMVGCIFPTIFVVLLGPAVLTVVGDK